MSLLVLPIPLALPGAPKVPSAGREIWGSPSPPWHQTGLDQHPPAALPPQDTAPPPPAPSVIDPHHPLLRGRQRMHEVKQGQKSVCKGRVYRRRLSSRTPMTFRRGRRCQRTHAHAVSFMLPLLPGASNARLGSAPTPCRTVCPPWLAPPATLRPRCALAPAEKPSPSPAPARPRCSSPSPRALCTLFSASRLSGRAEVTASPWQPSLPLPPPIFPPLFWCRRRGSAPRHQPGRRGSVPVVPAPLPWFHAGAWLAWERLAGGDARAW